MSLKELVNSIIHNKPDLPPIPNANSQKIFELLDTIGTYDPSLNSVLEELLINAKEHGQAPLTIYSQNTTDCFTFAIVDHGPGIHQTLPKNIRLSDIKGKTPAALIRLSLEEGISGTGTMGRGIGLSLLSELCKNRDGECIIISDGGQVHQKGSDFNDHQNGSTFSGTIVALKVKV